MDWLQAVSLLQSLKDNIPDGHGVDKRWTDDFHLALDAIEKEIGVNLTAFHIPTSDFHHPPVGASRNYVRHGRLVRGTLRVNQSVIVISRERLLHKVDAALHYLRACSTNEVSKPGIGFRAS